MNPRCAGTAAARLHRMNRRNGGAEKAPGFGEPPRIGDDGLVFAHLVVVPTPRLRLNWLAHRGHGFEMVIILAWLLGTEFPQHTNRRGRGMKNIDAQTLGDAPWTPCVRKSRHAFVQHARRGIRKGTVDNVRMACDPADVRHTPIGIFGMNVEDPFGRAGYV